MRISDWSSDVCSSDLALGRLGRQRRLEAELADLLVQVVGVVAHHRAEHRAAAVPLRGAGRAHARVAGALLAEQLAGRAGNLAAGLHLVGAGATLGKLPVHHARQDVLARRQAEHGVVELDLSGLLVVECRDGTLHRSEEHTSELQSLMRISYAV